MSYYCQSRGSAHGDCNINVKLNQNIPAVSYNLKVKEELGRTTFYYARTRLVQSQNKCYTKCFKKKYLSLSINNKLRFIDNFHFLSSSLDRLVKKLNKDNFKYLSQEFGKFVLDLVKQKVFDLFECMSDFESFK